MPETVSRSLLVSKECAALYGPLANGGFVGREPSWVSMETRFWALRKGMKPGFFSFNAIDREQSIVKEIHLVDT